MQRTPQAYEDAVFFRPPGGAEDYVVERSVDNITQHLLADGAPDDEDDHNVRSEQHSSPDPVADDAARDVTAGDVADMAISECKIIAPPYWKRGFVPLNEKEVNSLERDGGSAKLQEYLDKR